MKLNNKGFAVSTIMYIILIMAVILITLILALLSNRKNILDKLKQEVKQDIYKICNPVTQETKTTGNIPQGNFEPGDEYICAVNEYEEYHFFVLSKNGTYINLIMDSNITIDGKPIKSDGVINLYSSDEAYKWHTPWVSLNYLSGIGVNISCADDQNLTCVNFNNYGPITLLNYLNEATSNWDNIPNLHEYYRAELDKEKGEEGNFLGVEIKGKARAPKKSEINALFFDNSSSLDENYSVVKLPLWLTNYLDNGAEGSYYYNSSRENISRLVGYWLMAPVSTSKEPTSMAAYDVLTNDYGGWQGYSTVTFSTNKVWPCPNNNCARIGARPVISLTRESIKASNPQIDILPDEYQEVEYIQNDRTQYIDAGFIPDNNTSIDITFKAIDTSGSQYITGAREPVGTYDGLIIYALSGSLTTNKWTITIDNQYPFGVDEPVRTINKVRSSLTINNGTATWTLTDLIENSVFYNSTATVDVPNSSYTMHIFAFNEHSIHKGLRIYNYKAYKGNQMIRNFKPCYRKSDSVIGLYDLVEGKFYTNIGTGSFSKGSDV